MMSEWRPVEKIELKCDCIEDECNAELHVDDRLVIEADGHLSSFVLPDGHAVCERIPDEPIGVKALREGGWEFVRGKWLSPEHRTTHAAISVELATGLPAVVRGVDSLGPVISFPGCTTMRQLDELIGMLGGGTDA